MKINLVATGGTIGSRFKNGELVISDAATAQIAAVLGANKVFGDFKIHSAGVDLADLNTLRLTIERALEDEPDGVVVTHGTDTLAYSASYLAYAFGKTRVPIVMCAADEPLTADYSNGFDVLNAAKGFIARKTRGVFVLYKNPGEMVRIHHGARLIPAHLHENFYFSLDGELEFVNTGLMNGMDFELKSSNVISISPYVGMNYDTLNVSECSAIVHGAYHSGRIKTDALNAFARSHPDIPVFLLLGAKKYAKDTFAPNITQCRGITKSALYIKLLIALNNNVKNIPAFVLKDACGETVI